MIHMNLTHHTFPEPSNLEGYSLEMEGRLRSYYYITLANGHGLSSRFFGCETQNLCDPVGAACVADY